MGSMPCCSAALRWLSNSLRANRPPWTRGCSVFKRPSIISGNPVRSSMARTVNPAASKARAVPPVETSSTPRSASAVAKGTMSVLSLTDRRARRTATKSVGFCTVQIVVSFVWSGQPHRTFQRKPPVVRWFAETGPLQPELLQSRGHLFDGPPGGQHLRHREAAMCGRRER